MEIAGTILMLTGIGIIGYTAIVWGLVNNKTRFGQKIDELWPFPTPQWVLDKRREKNHATQQTLEDLRPETGEQLTRQQQTGSFLVIDGERVQVRGEGLALELQFFGGDKRNKVHITPSGGRLREFRLVAISGKDILLEQPEGEGKSVTFYRYNDVTARAPIGLSEMMKGTDTRPGPATRFAKSNQTAHVTVDLLGSTWVMQDIVWADVQVGTGKLFGATSADEMSRVAILLMRNETDEGEWAIFVDARSGSATDSLWVGRQINVDASVSTL